MTRATAGARFDLRRGDAGIASITDSSDSGPNGGVIDRDAEGLPLGERRGLPVTSPRTSAPRWACGRR